MSSTVKIALAFTLGAVLASALDVGWALADRDAVARGASASSLGMGSTDLSLAELGRRALGAVGITAIAGLLVLGTVRRTTSRLPRARTALASAAPRAETADGKLADAAERLRHWDRVATLGRIASAVAHDLGTPLNVIEGRASMLASEGASSEVRRNAEIIVQQATKMTSILRDLVAFARRRPIVRTNVDVADVVKTAAALADRAAKMRAIEIVVVAPPDAAVVAGDSDRILQVVMNLLTNAIQATPPGGKLTLKVYGAERRPEEDPEGPAVPYECIEVRDEGAGIAEAEISKIFRPFYTTKDTSEGAGLGLSVAQGIARDHGGWIDVESQPGRGACFTVLLPKGDPHA